MNLRTQLRIAVLPDGRRAAVLDTVIPDNAPEQIREGLARRAIVNGGGVCPCGARMTFPNRKQRRAGITHIDTLHENGCPAVTSALRRALRIWQASQ